MKNSLLSLRLRAFPQLLAAIPESLQQTVWRCWRPSWPPWLTPWGGGLQDVGPAR